MIQTWYDLIWYDMREYMRYDILNAVCYAVIWCDMTWYEMIGFHDVIGYNLIWHDMRHDIWYDISLWIFNVLFLVCKHNNIYNSQCLIPPLHFTIFHKDCGRHDMPKNFPEIPVPPFLNKTTRDFRHKKMWVLDLGTIHSKPFFLEELIFRAIFGAWGVPFFDIFCGRKDRKTGGTFTW